MSRLTDSSLMANRPISAQALRTIQGQLLLDGVSHYTLSSIVEKSIITPLTTSQGRSRAAVAREDNRCQS